MHGWSIALGPGTLYLEFSLPEATGKLASTDWVIKYGGKGQRNEKSRLHMKRHDEGKASNAISPPQSVENSARSNSVEDK